MNIAAATDTAPRPLEGTPRSNFSRVLRRIHMFLGLFFAPWLLMYALSTAVMAHRDFVGSFYRTKLPAAPVERELDYTRSFPANATPQQIAEQILGDLGLTGTHRVSGGRGGKPVEIERQSLLGLRRITFEPQSGRITVRKEEFRGPVLLERMHRRRGFQQPYAIDDAWALSVDIAMIAMVAWALSGLWLWWELRTTRVTGAVWLGAGVALFILFLVSI